MSVNNIEDRLRELTSMWGGYCCQRQYLKFLRLKSTDHVARVQPPWSLLSQWSKIGSRAERTPRWTVSKLYKDDNRYTIPCYAYEELKFWTLRLKIITYAIILTFRPAPLAAMSLRNSSALSSIDAEAGTDEVITLMPFICIASLIPRQYCTPGKYFPARWSSSNPSSP